MNRRLVTALLFSICLLGLLCAEDWTVLVYMAADNDLDSYAVHDICLMEEATQPQGLNLVVQVDLPQQGAKRYLIEENPAAGINSRVLQYLGEINSGDPDSLKDFILWGFNRYPAERKMLVIWSHADSWYKSSKYIAPDHSSESVIGVANGELLSALRGTPHLDILLFDACSMQSIEILYELREQADIIIGSADEVPVAGFPYKDMIPLFTGDPEPVAAAIPELYTDFYEPGTPNNPSIHYFITTCSAVKTAGLDDFYRAFGAFADIIWPHAELMTPIRADLFEMNSGYADVDIRQFLARLDEADLFDSSELLSKLNDMILGSSYTMPWLETDLCSIALWYPDIKLNLDWAWRIYVRLAFPKNGWLSVINQALGPDITPPQRPQLRGQYQRFGNIRLNVQAPADIDSLYYRLESNHASFNIYPPAYAAGFELSFLIDGNGGYRLYAIDRSQNVSEPLVGNYNYEAPRKGVLIRPNPIRDTRLAFLEWYPPEDKSELVQISLYNLKGQRVLRKKLQSGGGYGILKLDEVSGFSNLPAGIYILEIKTAGVKMRKKLTILN